MIKAIIYICLGIYIGFLYQNYKGTFQNIYQNESQRITKFVGKK